MDLKKGLRDTFGSRKWSAMAIAVVLMVFGKSLGVELNEDQIIGVATVVAGYLVGQGIVDAKQNDKPSAPAG